MEALILTTPQSLTMQELDAVVTVVLFGGLSWPAITLINKIW